MQFLTATGQMCDERRQEFVLLSDVLGLSSLVDIVNAADGATESTVLGPFYVQGAPVRAMGEHIGRPGTAARPGPRPGDRPAGQPVDEATLDVWQSDDKGLRHPGPQPSRRSTCAACSSPARTAGSRSAPAAVQLPDPDRRPGRRPASWPPGHPWRAAHIHAIVSAPGYRRDHAHLRRGEPLPRQRRGLRGQGLPGQAVPPGRAR